MKTQKRMDRTRHRIFCKWLSKMKLVPAVGEVLNGEVLYSDFWRAVPPLI